MKFFVPGASTPQLAEEVYQQIKEWNSKRVGRQISDRRIYSIGYNADGDRYNATVGESDERLKEVVIAIIETSGFYLVCSDNRGVLRGDGMLVDGAYGVKEFDGE